MRFVPRLPAERANVSPGHPLVELTQLVVGGVAVLWLLYALLGVAVDAVASRISPERERALFAPLLTRIHPATAEDAQRLTRILDRLAPASPQPILGTTEKPDLDALALPGRAILVTRGLLDGVDDDELAFVLAHELAHLEHHDNLRALGRGLVVSLARSLLGFEAASSPLELAQLTSRLSTARFSRDRERRADARAVGLLAERGLDTNAAVRLFERLRERQGRGDRLLVWLANHPLTDHRIAAVRALAARQH